MNPNTRYSPTICSDGGCQLGLPSAPASSVHGDLVIVHLAELTSAGVVPNSVGWCGADYA